MGKFKVSSVLNLDDVSVGAEFEESDFATLTSSGKFVQMKYIDTDEKTVHKLDVKPGIYTIVKTMAGLDIETTSFNQDKILDEFVHTEEITNKVDCFFRNLHKYEEFGIEVPKRGVLLYGPPGTGKSTSISKVIRKYTEDNKTAVLVWDTTKWEAYQVKDLIRGFNYVGVEKLILIVEDIGGIEMDQVRMRADSSLLSLLDNQEKTFTIATCIIATTNHPENFMAALTNRSGRFDDKIKVGYPPGSARAKLLEFFSKGTASSEAMELIASKDCEEFPPAHIREVVIRSAIHEKPQTEIIKEMQREIRLYKKAFEEKSRGVGFSAFDD